MLCTSFRPELAFELAASVAVPVEVVVEEVVEEEVEEGEKESVGTMPRCSRRADTREVMRAAEEPRPVLCTEESCTPVWRKGGSWEREASVGGRFRAVSYIIPTKRHVSV